MKIVIYPLEKVEINGVPIFFGMEKTAVEASFGKGEMIRGRLSSLWAALGQS